MNFESLIISTIPVISIVGCGILLPITVIWLKNKRQIKEAELNTQILLTAIDKNSDLDVADIIKKMAAGRLTLKERLIKKLMWGSILTALGIAILGYAIWTDFCGGTPSSLLNNLYIFGSISLFIGVAILLVFFISKRMLKKELEAENNNAGKNG